MSKVAVMTSANRADAPISGHFGKAEWIMIADTECRAFGFVPNEGGNGKGVVEVLKSHDCRDVIFREIGQGALQQLNVFEIHGWLAPKNIDAQQALKMLEHKRLQGVTSTTHGGGCGCMPQSGPTACCGGCQ